jgi:hypothetical protein
MLPEILHRCHNPEYFTTYLHLAKVHVQYYTTTYVAQAHYTVASKYHTTRAPEYYTTTITLLQVLHLQSG